jgi:hypothetical protein
MNIKRRYRRGDTHPTDPALVFFRYNRGKEVWCSVERLAHARMLTRPANAKQRAKPEHREKMRLYAREYNRRPHRKKYHSSYYKRPDVRQRIRDLRNAKPEVIARRQKREAWRAERAAYRQTEEYKALVRESGRKCYRKRQQQGRNAEYYRKKRKSNPQYRLASNMRRMVHFALTRSCGYRMAGRTFDLIGCSIEHLKKHLESQFDKEMLWQNYGSHWHVDHRLPLAMFDLSDPNQQRLAFHFENLRPLLKTLNHRKSDKVEIEGEMISARKIIKFKAA